MVFLWVNNYKKQKVKMSMVNGQKIEELKNLEEMIEILKREKNYKEAIKYGMSNYNVAQYKINKVRL